MSSLFALFASLLVVVLLSSIVEARVYKKHYEFGRRIQNWKVAKVIKPHRHHGTINTRVRPTRRHLLDEKSMLSNEVNFYSKIPILSTSYSYQYADKTTSSSTVNVRLVPTKTIRSTSYSSLPSAPIMTNINREVQAYASLSDMEGTTNSTKHQTSVEIRSNIVVVVIVFGLSFVILFMYLLCRKKRREKRSQL